MLKRLGLALLTPLLLWLSWPESGISPLLFIAFIPLLLLERDLSLSGERKVSVKWFWYSWFSFGTWNLLATWWLVNAHWSGVATTVLLNGVLMALVMTLFRFVKLNLGLQRGYISLPFFWICFESLHKDWDFSFPWLTLGYGFADDVEWIQWYEYTGSFGGTLWIWMVNLLLFWIITAYLRHKEWKPLTGQLVIVILLAVIVPIYLSWQRYENYEEKGVATDVVVVQPNLDAYTEKFQIPEEEQLDKFISLAEQKLDTSIEFLVGPETMLPNGIWESQIEYYPAIRRLKNLVRKYPRLNIILGASTLKFYENEHTSPTARELENQDGFYDAFNSALLINSVDSVQIYHKSKLVVGVEMMPYVWVVEPLLGDIVQDFGGISGALGIQQERENFPTTDGDIVVAPSICWESDFGEYTTRHIEKGANLIFIITNDDWWGETQGHIQHMHYARLRAVENRRSIARSANTGISCFINQRGDVFQRQAYKTDAVIRQKIKANAELTFYTKTGDLLTRVSIFMGIFFLLYSLTYGFLKKKQASEA